MLAPKMCMKFVIKCYHSRDVDCQKIFLRTINKLHHARLLLDLEQSLVMKGGSDIASCYSPASISAQFYAIWLFWKYWYQRNFALLACGACNFSPCLWKLQSRMVLTSYYSVLFLSGFYLGVLENFYKERQSSSDGSLHRSRCLLPHQRILNEPQLPTLWFVCGALGRISMKFTCAA
jgi:hypothetical protein